MNKMKQMLSTSFHPGEKGFSALLWYLTNPAELIYIFLKLLTLFPSLVQSESKLKVVVQIHIQRRIH